jgi:hypothetical protein
MSVSPELSYYRRKMATPEGRARIALIRRTQRRTLSRLKRASVAAGMEAMRQLFSGETPPKLPARPPIGAFGRRPRKGDLF